MTEERMEELAAAVRMRRAREPQKPAPGSPEAFWEKWWSWIDKRSGCRNVKKSVGAGCSIRDDPTAFGAFQRLHSDRQIQRPQAYLLTYRLTERRNIEEQFLGYGGAID